jgi:hypothetical protein
MASGDFADLYSKAIYGSRRDTSDSFDVSRAKEAINEAYTYVASTGDPWDWLEKEAQFIVEAGLDVYSYDTIGAAVGTNVDEIHTLTMDSDSGGGWVLDSMSWPALERISSSTQDDEQTGEPLMFAKWSRRIRLFPAPDQAYTLGMFYRIQAQEMTNDSDVPLLPVAWRTRLLVPYACARLLRQEGGSDAANEAGLYMADFEKAFREARTALATAKQTTFSLQSPSWHWGGEYPHWFGY